MVGGGRCHSNVVYDFNNEFWWLGPRVSDGYVCGHFADGCDSDLSLIPGSELWVVRTEWKMIDSIGGISNGI